MTRYVVCVPASVGGSGNPSPATARGVVSAMEGAGKLVEDDDLREAMEAKGLGTPATRAAVIEGLIFEKYVQREGRDDPANRLKS